MGVHVIGLMDGLMEWWMGVMGGVCGMNGGVSVGLLNVWILFVNAG